MAVPPAGAAINPSIEHAKSEYFIELNQALLTDLENQMSDFLALDTDLARASAADIRVQISITQLVLVNDYLNYLIPKDFQHLIYLHLLEVQDYNKHISSISALYFLSVLWLTLNPLLLLPYYH